ncbi:MAG: H-X9-DG-CTERM domain-containing protein [Planctomycetota bacterium]
MIRGIKVTTERGAWANRFTLVELCVVVTVLAMTAFLVVSAANEARAEARGITCIEKQGRIARGIQQHMDDHDGKVPEIFREWSPDFPSPGGFTSADEARGEGFSNVNEHGWFYSRRMGGYGNLGLLWMDRLLPYIGGRKFSEVKNLEGIDVYRCPEMKQSKGTGNKPGFAWPRNPKGYNMRSRDFKHPVVTSSYNLNTNLAGKRIDKVKNPDDTILGGGIGWATGKSWSGTRASAFILYYNQGYDGDVNWIGRFAYGGNGKCATNYTIPALDYSRYASTVGGEDCDLDLSMHQGKSHFFMVDGHVETFDSDDPELLYDGASGDALMEQPSAYWGTFRK